MDEKGDKERVKWLGFRRPLHVAARSGEAGGGGKGQLPACRRCVVLGRATTGHMQGRHRATGRRRQQPNGAHTQHTPLPSMGSAHTGAESHY